jgi:IS1 family transposase
MNESIRDIACQAVECDEIWGFIGKKQRQVSEKEKLPSPPFGGAYSYVALDPDSKAVITFALGKRDQKTTGEFIKDLSERVTCEPQISTDGFLPYIPLIQQHFGPGAHYAQVVKHYDPEPAGRRPYSPPKVNSQHVTLISGNPKKNSIGTAYVERNNWTMRTNLRRLTRLSNGFSRKFANMKAALSLWFWYYNFCRIHTTTRTTPAMAAGVTTRLWNLEELIA